MSVTAVPKPSASILLIRDSREGLEVLMMQRARSMAFAPGAFVFPGGKVDPSDARRSLWRAHITSRTWSTGCADMPFRIAALRELWEEVGILYSTGINRCPGPHVDMRLWLKTRRARLATDNLVPFARWITPEAMPKRYDTMFYVAPVLGTAFERADGNEAISARWVNVRRLLADWHSGEIPLMFPTRMNLMKLSQRDTVQGALHHARTTPVAEVLPVTTQDGRARKVSIAGGAGFGAAAATEREMMVEAPVNPLANTPVKHTQVAGD